MKTKSLTIEAMDEAGKGLARIATLSAVDSDGDTYAPGAFSWKAGGFQWCSILPAHDRRATPLGKARVYEEGDAALAELHFNLDIPEAKSWHSAILFDLSTGQSVQEYSYGFEVMDADFQQRGMDKVRVIKRQDVHEVSPVLKGAGAGTGTLSMKSAALKDNHFTALLGGLGELAAGLPADATIISATGIKQLEELERSIGAVLAPLRESGAKEKAAVDQALAGYLLHQSRPFLLP